MSRHALPRALLFLLVPLLLPRLLVQSGFFPALLLLHEMTSSTPADAAAVWQMRTSLLSAQEPASVSGPGAWRGASGPMPAPYDGERRVRRERQKGREAFYV